MKIGFYLRQLHPNAEIVWVSVEELEKIWGQSDQDYIKSWEGDPNYKWFFANTAFLLAEISIDNSRSLGVDFLNGQHRTRWLMQQGLREIPIGLPVQEIEMGKQIGLIIRDFENQEFVEISDEAIGQALIKRQNSIKENYDLGNKKLDELFKNLRIMAQTRSDR